MSHLKVVWEVVEYLWQRISETRVLEAAAAIAYYAIFSFFPLILFIIAFNSSFLQSAEVQEQILKFVQDNLPGSEDLVKGNIRHLIHSSGTVGIAGTVVLLWAATLVFAGFSQNINLAWTNSKTRHFLMERLVGLMMISVIIVFLIISLIFNTVSDILPMFFPKFLETYLPEVSRFQKMLIDYLPIGLMLSLFVILYKYVPNVIVRWREALVGAIFSASALQFTKAGFIYYLSLGTGNYRLIYGSLGAVVAFMLWIYLSSCIILIGSHVSATVAHLTRIEVFPEKKQPEKSPAE